MITNTNYKGYIIMAQNERDYENKKRKIDRGDIRGFILANYDDTIKK